jgi:hypothetical protein
MGEVTTLSDFRQAQVMMFHLVLPSSRRIVKYHQRNAWEGYNGGKEMHNP